MPALEMNMGGALPPLTAHTALSTWQVAGAVDVLAVLAALAYLHRAHRVLPKAGQHWPAGRTIAFLGSLVVAVLTLSSSIDVYSDELFYLHMIEHLLLIMVVPVLFMLGRPLALLTTGEDRTSMLAGGALGTRTVSVLTFPPLGLALYAIVLIGTHLTGFMQLMLTHMWLHNVEVALYLISGYLFLVPLLGDEPLRRVLSYPLRVFLLMIGMTVDTVVGVVLMLTAREPFPAYAADHRTWGPSLITDIHTGGGIMWVIGDGLMFLIIVLLVKRWMADTERQNDTGKWLESARRSSMVNLGVDSVDPDDESDIDDDDAALDAYNRMLSRLNDRDH
ncbi:MAG TPA: cytochrome c oxidase assembly protein [Pseudonocardiaceae bacterium]|nr:cytochrome c oxidase assembly protein [Pseudonocardiaceae bacterium]